MSDELDNLVVDLANWPEPRHSTDCDGECLFCRQTVDVPHLQTCIWLRATTLIYPDHPNNPCVRTGQFAAGVCEWCKSGYVTGAFHAPMLLDDGFGNVWETCGPDCTLQIVRPGKVQYNGPCDCEDNDDA